MAYLKLIAIILGLWGGVELLMAIVGFCTNGQETVINLIIALVCLVIAVVVHTVIRIRKRFQTYID